MEVLDTTVANVALPYIAGAMGVSEDEASWVVTTYLVSNAIILTASPLADLRSWVSKPSVNQPYMSDRNRWVGLGLTTRTTQSERAAGAGAITVPHKSRNAPLKPLAGVEQIENQLGQLGCTKEQVKRHVNQATISRMDAAKANRRPGADEG